MLLIVQHTHQKIEFYFEKIRMLCPEGRRTDCEASVILGGGMEGEKTGKE